MPKLANTIHAINIKLPAEKKINLMTKCDDYDAVKCLQHRTIASVTKTTFNNFFKNMIQKACLQ